jgi:hypothetical protein
MKSYGNTGTPITMDMGCFKIFYREPILGGNRQAIHKTSTMLQAVAEFNTLERTSLSPEGLTFDTPLRIERFDTFGNHTDTWLMDGRYDVPRHTNGQVGEPSKTRTYRQTRRAA